MNRVGITSSFLVIVVASFLCACDRAQFTNSKLTPENLQKIHVGMTEAKVKDIIGETNLIFLGDGVQGYDPNYAEWTYRSDGVNKIDILFQGGKASSVHLYSKGELK